MINNLQTSIAKVPRKWTELNTNMFLDLCQMEALDNDLQSLRSVCKFMNKDKSTFILIRNLHGDKFNSKINELVSILKSNALRHKAFEQLKKEFELV